MPGRQLSGGVRGHVRAVSSRASRGARSRLMANASVARMALIMWTPHPRLEETGSRVAIRSSNIW
jgi:hypothetical protein